LVHLATGLGKTSVGVFDVMKFREEQLAQDPPVIPRILFVSHMNDISEQAHERFKHFMPDLETEYFKTGRRDLPDADITFATFQSLHSELDRFDPQDFEYIIYDEAHHSEADTFREVREHFDPLFELALTATPGRMDDRDIRDYFGEALYSKTLAEGIAEGWLADVDYHIVFDDIVKQLMEEGFEPKTLKEFHELFEVRPRNEVIAKNIRDEQHKIGLDNAKTIVFCESVAHAEEMAELLDGVAYHSGVKKGERKNLLNNFRNGDSKVICTVDMFNEGIDIPDARLLVFLRSTQSGNIFEQQLGRGLRRAPGKERVSVLDFVANIERIQSVRELGKNIRAASDSELGNDRTIVDTFPDDKADDLRNAEDGLQIHTAHGEFDFESMVVDLLGKWDTLKQKVDFDTSFAKMANYEIIDLAKKLSPDTILTTPAIDDLSRQRLFPGSSTVIQRFGSIKAFQEACGFEQEEDHAKRERLIALAQEISPEKALTVSAIRELSKLGQFPSTTTIKKLFGEVSNFQEACGFDTRNKFNSNDNTELIELAKKISPNEPLNADAIAELAKQQKFVSGHVIRSRFGSLQAFQEACGFKIGPSTDELVAIALQISPDKNLTKRDIETLSKNGVFPLSVKTLAGRFGSLKTFQDACERARRDSRLSN
ncbi:MAG TPA: DEAD/DEAH box helicase, partial [Nitrososphaeraceae archaeon]|nr:DEAD/DEAH box helicase [Nitrososphaeraceae archaeon]